MENSLVSNCSNQEFVSASEEIAKQVRGAIDDLKTELGKYIHIPSVLKNLPPPPSLRFCSYSAPSTPNVVDDDDDYSEAMCEKLNETDDELVKLKGEMKQAWIMMWYLAFDYKDFCPPWRPYLGEIESIIKRYLKRIDKAVEIYYRELGLPPYVNPAPWDDSTPLLDLFHSPQKLLEHLEQRVQQLQQQK